MPARSAAVEAANAQPEVVVVVEVLVPYRQYTTHWYSVAAHHRGGNRNLRGGYFYHQRQVLPVRDTP